LSFIERNPVNFTDALKRYESSGQDGDECPDYDRLASDAVYAGVQLPLFIPVP